MKKEQKKKLENDLIGAIETVLIKHNSRALAKAKKSVKQAAKAVVKKFNKSAKALEEKKSDIKNKKKKSGKLTIRKKPSVLSSGETAKISRTYSDATDSSTSLPNQPTNPGTI